MPAETIAEAALADYERDPRGVRCAVYERFPELGCR